MPHPASLTPDALLQQCDTTRTRRSGPGGQNRNKLETAIVLTHTPTGITAEASERRSQRENLSAALFRLRLKLAVAIRTPVTAPSDLWLSRVRGSQIHVNESHDDFPTLLAEALDHLAAHDHDPRPTAAHLGISATQLINLLKQYRPALESLNQVRRQRNQPPLK